MPERGIEIKVPAAAAWNLLTDMSRWPEWGPSVCRVESAEKCLGPGSSGRILTVFGVWLPFRVTEWVAGQRWVWEVAGIKATGHRVESLGPGRCRVTFEVPLWAVPYLAVCRLAAEKLRKILEEEQHCL